MAHGAPLDLVILRRDPVPVATSLYLWGTVPARTPPGLQFLLSPGDPGVLPPVNWQDLHDWAQIYKAQLAELGGRRGWLIRFAREC